MLKIVKEIGVTSTHDDLPQLQFELDTLNQFFIGDIPPRLPNTQFTLVRISPDDNQFFFRHVEPDEVVSIVLSARSNARGTDDIPINYIKECLSTILPILLNIFDHSRQSGIFPTPWKKALVHPIPKRHTPLEPSHFRPVSILCAASKILETLAFKQLSNYISERKLLDTFQSGFRKHHSTHTALVSLADDIKEAIDDKKIVLAVAIDHTRAFDLVNPDLHIKLKELGVSDSACS